MIVILHFYDFEIFKHDWLVVIKNPFTKTRKVIVNDKKALNDYYEQFKDEIFVGYNSRQYDQYIFKGILCDFDPYKISDFIINKKNDGWRYSRLLNQIPLNNYDVMPNPPIGLKTMEAFMGHNIKETSVSFNIERKLTQEEIEQTIYYCEHDVDETMEVFLRKKEEFDTMWFLINKFNLPLSFINKTKAQAVAMIAGGNSKGGKFDDEFDYKILDCVKIKKYTKVIDFFKNAKNDTLKAMNDKRNEILTEIRELKQNAKSPRKIAKLESELVMINPNNKNDFKTFFYNRNLEIDIMGVPHVFAFGGIHGAIPKYYGEGIYLMADVGAYYPTMGIKYGFGKRVMDKWSNIQLIHNENIRLKHEGKKKERQPFKIADNGWTGQLKDKNSSIYDPMANNCICINGQLMLLDLLERLEEANCCELIQSNTDGILLKIRSLADYELVDDVVYEWEQRTGMTMEFDLYKRVYQKDVNNYCVVSMDGGLKTKGAYVKKLNDLDNDLPIVNKAIVEYMVNKTPVEKTIEECNDLIMYQKIVKISGAYMYGLHNGEVLNDKTFRVFASTNLNDTKIFKVKNLEKNPEKFANTPDHCFIENGNINEVKVDKRLNKKWYIELTKERLKQFGVL